jgi:hypothetical protein
MTTDEIIFLTDFMNKMEAIAIVNAKVAGMVAENRIKEMQGEYPQYTNVDFAVLLREKGLEK